MSEITIEEEAMDNIKMHKFAILVKKVKQYYMDYYRMNNTVFLFPDTLEDNAHRRARAEVRALYLRDKKEYNRLYEEAYKEYENTLN